MALVLARGVDRAGRVEIDVARRAERVVGAEDRLQRRRAVGRGDDGLVDAVGRVVGDTRSGATVAGRCGPCSVTHSASQRLAMPSSCGKSQGLSLPSSSRKYFSSVSLASRKATSFGRRRFKSSSVWMLGCADDGGVLGLGRDVGRREGKSGVFGKRGRQPLAGQVVAVADQAGEGDLAGDAAFQGTDAGRQRAGLGLLGRAAARDEREGHAVDFGIFRLEHGPARWRRSSSVAARGPPPARREAGCRRRGRPGRG